MKSYVRIISRLLAALPLAGAALPSLSAYGQVSAEQVLNIGRNVLAMDDYVLSIQYFNQAAKAKPYMADPYYYRGLAKLMLEDYRGAEADCTMAIERNAYKVEPYRVRGFARMRLGRDSLAVGDFDTGLRYSPQDKYFMYYKGIALSQLERYAEADSTFSLMLRYNPRFTEGYTARAQMHLMTADTTAALGDIGHALQLGANELAPFLMRAEISMKRADWAQACADMDKALTLSPREGDLYVNRAYARYTADDWTGAMSDYDYALALDPENRPARYNRALLRFQVQDLDGARTDFTKILEWDPEDFATRYNRGLVNLELDNPRAALADFQVIARRYPRFYPIYYAMARAYQDMGNQKAYTDMFFKANDLISKYTDNPRKFQLDRPTIQRGRSDERANSVQKREYGDEESVEEVMDAFTRLVTISQKDETAPAFGDKLKGRVQDVDARVEPEGFYALTFVEPVNELRPSYNYFRELAEINREHWVSAPLYLSPHPAYSLTSEEAVSLFAYAEGFAGMEGSMRPVDYLARGVAYCSLKNYEAALSDLDKAVTANPDFVSALLQRAYVRHALMETVRSEGAGTGLLPVAGERAAYEAILADLDKVLELDPNIIYAWHNKGFVLYNAGNMQEAVKCFTQALQRNADFGEAYYNRGLAYLSMGDKARGVADISKAGELGVVPAYNLLKRLK